MGKVRVFGDSEGSVLVETALGVAAILLVALPFASLIEYGGAASRDVAAAHTAARAAALTRALPGAADMQVLCASTPAGAARPCGGSLERGEYVIVLKNTTVRLPFGLALDTRVRAVSYVE